MAGRPSLRCRARVLRRGASPGCRGDAESSDRQGDRRLVTGRAHGDLCRRRRRARGDCRGRGKIRARGTGWRVPRGPGHKCDAGHVDRGLPFREWARGRRSVRPRWAPLVQAGDADHCAPAKRPVQEHLRVRLPGGRRRFSSLANRGRHRKRLAEHRSLQRIRRRGRDDRRCGRAAATCPEGGGASVRAGGADILGSRRDCERVTTTMTTRGYLDRRVSVREPVRLCLPMPLSSSNDLLRFMVN